MKTYDISIQPDVFNPVYYPNLNNLTPLQIYFGGSSSGKSVFAVGQRTVYDLLKGGRNYLIVRQVSKTLRGSVFNEVKKIIRSWGLSDMFKINKSDMTITCVNGYQIIFSGLDDVEKLKSITPEIGEITDIVIEEATETEYDSYKQLEKRQRGGSEKTVKRITLLFNPIYQNHWIYTNFFESIGWSAGQTEYKSDDLYVLKTTHKDNLFLTEQDHRKLENEKDRYYYNVYTLGNWGVLGHVIFTEKKPDDEAPGWYVDDLTGLKDQWTNRRNGLDFGFSSDPAALPATHYDKKHKTIYVFDEVYETGLTNDLLAEVIKVIIGSDRVACDSSEPKSIQELRNLDVEAYGVRKGKDSVLFGIQWLQQHTIIIDKRCVNMQNELRTYKWKEDAGGNALKIPVDKNNHLIDALRYAYEDDMTESESVALPDYSW